MTIDDPAIRLGKILYSGWETFHVSTTKKLNQSSHFLTLQAHVEQTKQSFPWQMYVLAAQAGLLFLLVVLWTVKLVKRGRTLVKTREEDAPEEEEAAREEMTPDERLLTLAKALVTSKLKYEDHQEEEERERLTNFLKDEYERVKKHGTKKARQLMMLKIRKSLVQHPYDQIGRRMAKETKDVFKRYVLEETSCLQRLECIFKLPRALRTNSRVKKAFLMLPIMFATFMAVKKGLVYSYDMASDILVIKELGESIDTFKIPDASQISNVTNVKLLDFFLKDVQDYGLPAVKEPCQILELIQQLCEDHIPLYKSLISDGANIHWNPNRNHKLDLNEAFKLLQVLPKIYRELRKASPPSLPLNVRELNLREAVPKTI